GLPRPRDARRGTLAGLPLRMPHARFVSVGPLRGTGFSLCAFALGFVECSGSTPLWRAGGA
ncbi:MAG: hypothetical protein WBE21_01555, partial [Candidatus Acidiferrales bacterium]